MRRLVLVLLLIAIPRLARAHQSSMTNSEVIVDGAQVHLTMLISPGDLAETLGHASGYVPDTAEIAAAAPAISQYVLGRVAISDGDTPCRNGAAALDEVDDSGRYVRLQWTATCPAEIQTLEIEYDLFFDLDPQHQAVLRVTAHGDHADTVLRDGASKFVWDLAEAPPSGLAAFLRLGVDHILSGFDHIAFLLTLLLVIVLERGREGGGWQRRRLVDSLRATALIVTSFTLAHTITLISASLGWVTVPGRLVESAIAASIAYTAVENIIHPDVRWRFVLTFCFGLIHGLGFARALEVILPPDDVVVPLLSFNVGVELGQLMIVAIALPTWWLLCGAVGPERYRRWLMPVLSGLLALAGALWLFDRIMGIKMFEIGS